MNSTKMCTTTEPSKPSAPTPANIDYAAIKQRQKAIWSSGDYATIGTTLQIVGEMLAEAADIRAGERVLDVAAGNGNATLAAARRFAHVTSTDYVPLLLEKGAVRAKAEGFDVQFRTEDAEDLRFEDESFDVVVSTFGVMFAPNQTRAAQEMMRVVRKGGRIGLANWTPEGFLGELLRLIASYVSPPPGISSPLLWGSEPRIVELFGSQATDIRCVRRHFNFRYHSTEHWIEVFTNYYGPLYKAVEALDSERRVRMVDDIVALLGRLNTGGSNSLLVAGEYLEVVITK
ncbi:MAG: class I SAM-dependent methyltransferase [Acidiferrobacterales bacterium]